MPTVPFTVKQNYLPSSNVLQTKFMNELGVASITDFLPRPSSSASATKPLLPWLIRRVECIRGTMPLMMQCAPAFNYALDTHSTKIVPDTSIPPLDLQPGTPTQNHQNKVVFTSSSGFVLDLRYITESTLDAACVPSIELGTLDLTSKGHKGLAAYSAIQLSEGQAVTFVLRTPPEHEAPMTASATRTGTKAELERKLTLLGPLGVKPRTVHDPFLTKELLHSLLTITNRYWYEWIRQSTYTGSWKEAVHRSALALKLLIYEPTGAVVASPTFSLPEFIGGTRNWDYRASWIRDSSFTLYALIRLGFTQEANAYMEFIFERLRHKNPDGSLQIMYTIHGGKDLEEIELLHLDGHKGSKPVRIGNGAADHVQLDIYGELYVPPFFFTNSDNGSQYTMTRRMDCIYLGQKVRLCMCSSSSNIYIYSQQIMFLLQFGKPLSYDDWVLVRELVDYVVANYKEPDLSIWEVRNKKRHFTYSKVDHVMLSPFPLTPFSLSSPPLPPLAPSQPTPKGLRLADKRSLPCPNRARWLAARDELYEEIMNKAWNREGQFFGQSYEDTDVLDSAVLIMPLVFFMHGSDPRFISSLKQILKSPERGGLTSNNLVYRYDVTKSEDGVGGEEGTFCLCTLWCVEALTRAGEYDKALLARSVSMFEDFLMYLNHVGLCTEEISDAGEALGNAVQGFTHVTLISAAYNLSRTLEKVKRHD
ncbi:hypothetical protein J132_03940 [Termitomyces sp. J132]|nr:hypothetical protein J132_03940 [Termitomyces sp. J132]